MISEDMPDKMKEIIRDTWPGIYMRPRRDSEGLSKQDKEGIKLDLNDTREP